MKGKRLGFILTLVLIMALAVPAWAADTKIDSVKLDFSYAGAEPKSGNEIGGIHVKVPDGQPFTVEYAEYSNEAAGPCRIDGEERLPFRFHIEEQIYVKRLQRSL